MATKKRQRGRPTKPAKQGEKTTLSLRVTPDMKRRLEEAGSATGRNLSQEAEIRLERSFLGEELLDQALELEFGQHLAGLILILGRVMRETGSHAGFAATKTLDGAVGWLGNPYAFEQATAGAFAVLEAFQPAGEVNLPDIARIKGGPKDLNLAETYRNLGRGFASTALSAILGNELTAEFSQWAARVRNKLGPTAVEQIRKFAERG
jgi:hypothetical protein